MKYPQGTIVRDKNGNDRIKINSKGKWIPQGRFVAQEFGALNYKGGELDESVKVYHLDMNRKGTENHNSVDNLVIIRQRRLAFKKLGTSHAIYIPKDKKSKSKRRTSPVGA